MKHLNKFLTLAAVAASLTFASCEKGGEHNPDNQASADQTAFMECYVDDVIMTRYENLSTAGKTMLTAVEAIAASNDSDKTALIKTASEAWVNARVAWERTEAYLFGPVDMAGIDPGIDSWPLVLPDLQASIQKWDVATGSYKTLKTDGGDLKGFHAIEYMLFANGEAKSTTIASFDSEYAIEKGSLSDAEFEDKLESYTVAVCEELYRCVLQLEAEWNLAGLSSAKKADYNAFGSDITLNTAGGNYAEIFKNPGLDNANYSSFNTCLFAAFEGAIGIADEVANVKIADPINAEKETAGSGLLEVESWFSHNSISDFTNNVRGVKEAFMGELCTSEASFDTDTTPAEGSLAAQTIAVDAKVGNDAIEALNAAIAAVKAMPAPFRNNLLDAKNAEAQNAVNAAKAALEAADAILVE